MCPVEGEVNTFEMSFLCFLWIKWLAEVIVYQLYETSYPRFRRVLKGFGRVSKKKFSEMERVGIQGLKMMQ